MQIKQFVFWCYFNSFDWSIATFEPFLARVSNKQTPKPRTGLETDLEFLPVSHIPCVVHFC